MSRLSIVAVSGNTHRPSRTRLLVEAIAAEVGSWRSIDLEVFDLVDIGEEIGAFSRAALGPRAAAIIRTIAAADGLIVGSPVYKGSYTGLFKHLFDLVEPQALAGKPVIASATGGGHRHALVVEHQLRPLFGFFGAHTVPTGVYASAEDFADGAPSPQLQQRIADAAFEFDRLLSLGRANRPSVARVA
ncbi:FMN reductase [Chelatococcus composti]|uniref:FMN reductase n=1 Tax=Chelatococcus composti TaxID=1743235 RepID=A0A841KB43_9HYPH|nr:FMN reductase [Chelatococcus composti]MBB6168632.1 FMN reductase [Chelatococcus composti]MBS7736288.1 FMN reductase [Chelatococcus composti]GGG41534.1 FMN reductase [Chelatococcus composti]